jgi:uncharacterized protein (UPF0335 family)
MYYQIDLVTAPIALEIFKRYEAGETMKPIMDSLNDRGIHAAHGGKFTLMILSKMLKNRKYIGEYKFRDTIVPDVIPAIVPRELFDIVQERLEKTKYAPARNKAADDKYLLTTKLFCGDCGSPMVGESGTSVSTKTYRYYKCANAKKKQGCKKKAIKKDWIEGIAVEYVMKKLFDDDFIEDTANNLVYVQETEHDELPALQTQLAAVEKNIDNMLNAIQDGVYNESTKGRLDQLEERKKDLQISIMQEEISKDFITKDKIIYWLLRFRKVDMSDYNQRQHLIDTFVNAIYIFDDRIAFTLNYKDGAKTVTLKDIESSDLSIVGVPKNR